MNGLPASSRLIRRPRPRRSTVRLKEWICSHVTSVVRCSWHSLSSGSHRPCSPRVCRGGGLGRLADAAERGRVHAGVVWRHRRQPQPGGCTCRGNRWFLRNLRGNGSSSATIVVNLRAETRMHTFLGGARLNLRTIPRVVPFVEVLGGAAHVSATATTTFTGVVIDPETTGGSDTHSVLQIGGGVTLRVSQALGIRVAVGHRRFFVDGESGSATRAAAVWRCAFDALLSPPPRRMYPCAVRASRVDVARSVGPFLGPCGPESSVARDRHLRPTTTSAASNIGRADASNTTWAAFVGMQATLNNLFPGEASR